MLVDDAELVPGEWVLIVAVHRNFQDLFCFREVLGVVGRDQRMAEHRCDQRRIIRPLSRLAKNGDRLLRLATLEQNLTLEFQEERIVRVLGKERVGFGHRFLRIAAEVIGISAGIMRRDALVALRIFADRLFWVDEPEQLGLDPLEARLERRVDGLAPGWVALQLLLQSLDPLRRQRVVAVEAVLRVITVAIFLILQLGEEIEHAFAADSGFRQEDRTRRVGCSLLGAGEGKQFAERGALARL